MVSLKSISAAAEQLVKNALPGEDVHHDLVPKNFKRPASLITLGVPKYELELSNLVSVKVPIEIVSFVETDEYHNSHYADLADREMRILRSLSLNYLKCEDRALHISDVSIDHYFDSTKFTIILEFMDDFDRSGDNGDLLDDVMVRLEVADGS